MARYTLAVRPSNVTIANAAWEIRSGAGSRLRVKEIGLIMAATGSNTFGIGFPAAIGVTPTSPVDFVAYDAADPLITNAALSALAWGTNPTVPAAFLRRFALSGVGTGVIYTFDDLVIPVSSSLVLWNITAGNLADVHAVVEY